MSGCGIYKATIKTNNNDTVYTGKGLFPLDPKSAAEAQSEIIEAEAYANYLTERAHAVAPTGQGNGHYKILVVNYSDMPVKAGIGSSEGVLPIKPRKWAEFTTDNLNFHLSVFRKGKPPVESNHRIILYRGMVSGPNGSRYDKIINLR